MTTMVDPVKAPRDLTKAEQKQIFTNETQTIINWAGENFYKACGELVTGDPINGPASYCLKRVDHPGHIHEDWDGNQKVFVSADNKMPPLFEQGDIVQFKGKHYKVGEEFISTGGHSEYKYVLTPMG